MSAVHLEVEGKLYPSADLDWVYYAPCGCVAGWMVVGTDFTADQAWKHFNDGTDPALAKRDQKLGARMELHPRDALPELTKKCPHTPTWGVPARPQLTDHTWLVNDGYGARRNDKAHLFNDGSRRSLCGKHENRYGKYQAYEVAGRLECATCMRKAANVTEAAA
ncbi:hypothetical protein [Curtobacterium sp. MCBD17_021]|uniref:hypothetical protein n=1 Tax=Curtobacterium sp. MCBD17_021 TaxID=2175665 RepID=UPI0015E8C0C2|nr:hypothetical protein [Curtobacterium sp. MCBD17_021]